MNTMRSTTARFSNLVTLALGLAAFSYAGCAEEEKTAKAAVTSEKDAAAATATAGPEVEYAKWNDIKSHAYDARAQFFAGLERLEARVDAQILELTSKRAAMKGSADTENWDFAMKEMDNARAYLKGMGEELGKATSKTWNQQKDKVGQAWVRTQAAYDKVKSSITTG
ncbi:MAG: hypothetical protein WD941_08660 [Opitutus sp.]